MLGIWNSTLFASRLVCFWQRSEYLRFAIEAYFAGDRVALVETMAERIQNLQAGDLGALVNYYSSYRSADY